jgi:hypothetical protein
VDFRTGEGVDGREVLVHLPRTQGYAKAPRSSGPSPIFGRFAGTTPPNGADCKRRGS